MVGRFGMHKVADLVFLIRPPLLCASSTFFFAGAVSALRSGGKIDPFRLMPEVLPNLVLFSLVLSAAFIVNQIFDIDSDRLNRKSFLLSSGVVSRQEGVVLLVAVCVSAVGLSLLYDTEVRYLSWMGLGLGFLYSVPPVRLKGRPILDMLANVVGFGVIGFAMGWLAYADVSRLLGARCCAYALAMCGIFLNTCIPDEEGDRGVGDRTSCVVFGRQAVGKAVLVFMLASAGVGVLTGEILCVLAVVGSLPAMVAVSVKPDSASSVVASQFAARLLLILVCIRAPLLAALSVAAYLGSRVYYRKRFGLRYPELTGAAEIAPPSL